MIFFPSVLVRVQSNKDRDPIWLPARSLLGVTIRVRLPREPARDELDLPLVLYALGDPIRLELVRQLSAVESLPCGNFRIDKAKSSLSHHFRVLRETGIIATWRDGTVLLNKLRIKDLESRFPGLLPAILRGYSSQKRPRE